MPVNKPSSRVAALILSAALLLSGCGGSHQETVTTEALQTMNLQETISTTGVVESQTGRKVYSTLSYPVESVNVEIGDTVQEGDVLAKLKTSDLELDIAQQQAAVDARKQQSQHQIDVSRKAYENAKNNYEQGLNPNAISAEQGVLQAKNNLEQAKKQVESAEAAVRDAKELKGAAENQIDTQLSAAYDGLAVAQEGLGVAQNAYNDAVQEQAEAQSRANQSKADAQTKYNEAQKEHNDYCDVKDENGKTKYDREKEKAEKEKAEAEQKEKDLQILVNAQKGIIERTDITNEARKEAIEALYGTKPDATKPDGGKEPPKGLLIQLEEAKVKTQEAEAEVQRVEAKKESLNNEVEVRKQALKNVEQGADREQVIFDQAVNQASGAVVQAKGEVAGANAQVQMAQGAKTGPEITQIEQGINQAKRGTESAELQKDMAKAQKDIAAQQKNASDNAILQQIDSLQDSLIGSQLAAQSNEAQEIAIEKMQNTLEDATIEAPVSGVVTAVYAKIGEPGNGLLFVVEDTQSLKITTKIKESDIGKVKVGMPVIIKSDATGDREIAGQIVEIAPAAIKTENGTTKAGDKDSEVEFEAQVQVNEADSGLLIGMNTRLTILLQQKEDVLTVPYDSLVEKADGSMVLYTLEQKDKENEKSPYIVTELPVTTGMETDFFVEVSGKGISNGLMIVSNPQSVLPGAEVLPDFAQGK